MLALLKVCGDVHGQYYDILRQFEYGVFPYGANYIFIGDYVDRDKQSLEINIYLGNTFIAADVLNAGYSNIENGNSDRINTAKGRLNK